MSIITTTNEKKRYSLVIADMEINIISDAKPEEVDKIVGILDRKMREINLKSRCCSKTEAALLCALDFCADRLSAADQIAELETRNQKYATVLSAFKEKLAILEATEADLRRENQLLRSLLGDGTANAIPETEVRVPPVTPTEFLAQVADAQMGEEVTSEPVQETIPIPMPTEQPKPKGRSRVGSMFDLLSFNEV